MEKGNSKSSSKSSTDGRNKQDAANKYPRSARFKDSISPRPDTRKKSNPQRTRELFDKRPRNRTGAVYEKYRSEITEQAVSEPYTRQGCKKTNLNHLLNFTLAPLDHWEGNGRRSLHNRPKFPKYNKELFLQANCQFVARDDGDYSIHQKNPDILVEWAFIEEIRLPCHEVPLCPICLYVPVAAKITRCGHVYCWPCMLHYLALTDKTWQKCPICFEAVHKTELKSVSLKVRKPFGVGDEITLCLMRREKGSQLSVPVMHEKLTHSSICNVEDVDSVTRYQKLLLASTEEVQLILNRERLELDQAYQNEKDAPEACFIESAIKLLDERESNVHKVLDNEKSDIKESIKRNANACGRKHLASISSIESNDEFFNLEINDNTLKMEGSPTGNNITKINSIEPDNKGISYFYQAEDGQHIYMHNVNVRMLLKEYGSLEFAPHIITARLVETERVTMTEALRKRLRYLQHLPLTCEFQVVELDFTQLVSESTIFQFESDIKKRRFMRNKKARDERRRERMIEQLENRKLGIYPKATYSLSSADQFPVYNPEDFLALSPPKEGINAGRHMHDQDVSATIVHSNNNPISTPSENWATTETNCVPVTSFAQMLRDGPKAFAHKSKDKKLSIDAPLLKTQPIEGSDGEDCTPPPEYRQSFSDAIQAALDSVTLQEPTGNNQSSSKKKKKGKKQLLFTTSMCRNN